MLKGYSYRRLLPASAAALLLLFTLQAWGSEIEPSNPYRLMQQVITQTLERIHREQQQIARDADYLRVIIRQELMPFAHLRYTGALILGPLFNTLDPAQQHRYFQALEAYLEQSYAQLIARYQHHRYQIEPEKPFATRNTVIIRLQILQKATTPLRIDFKWRKNSKTQQWQLYDILVEGISLVATKQQEWTALLHQSGIDVLIEQLRSSAQQPISLSKG